jgi:hypothetical protein
MSADRGAPTPPPRRRQHGGFFSSARTFSLQPGPHVAPGEVRGYYIDLRVKAEAYGWPEWVRPGQHYISTAQWGLGCYERYLAGDGERWLDWAREAGRYLLAEQRQGGRLDGAWVHADPFPHTFPLPAGWLSGMAQGEGASLLVRLHRETGEEAFADGARRALKPLAVPTAEGGVRSWLEDGSLPEEYPTTPPSFVLNGAIFGVWGYYDVWHGLGDEDAGRAFQEDVATLARNIHRWDAGFWSRYDLYPHPLLNVASSSYHALHISQLRVLESLTGRPEFAAVRERFERYATSRATRTRAFLHKSLFRLLVPRNRLLAWRLPWIRVRPARA